MASKHRTPDSEENGLNDEQKRIIEKLERLLAELPPDRRLAFEQHLESKIDEETSSEEIGREDDSRSHPSSD